VACGAGPGRGGPAKAQSRALHAGGIWGSAVSHDPAAAWARKLVVPAGYVQPRNYCSPGRRARCPVTFFAAGQAPLLISVLAGVTLRALERRSILPSSGSRWFGPCPLHVPSWLRAKHYRLGWGAAGCRRSSVIRLRSLVFGSAESASGVRACRWRASSMASLALADSCDRARCAGGEW